MLSHVVVEGRPRLNSELHDCWPFVFGPIYFEIFRLRSYLVMEKIRMKKREVSTEALVRNIYIYQGLIAGEVIIPCSDSCWGEVSSGEIW